MGLAASSIALVTLAGPAGRKHVTATDGHLTTLYQMLVARRVNTEAVDVYFTHYPDKFMS
jgi:hypothetical protein